MIARVLTNKDLWPVAFMCVILLILAARANFQVDKLREDVDELKRKAKDRE